MAIGPVGAAGYSAPAFPAAGLPADRRAGQPPAGASDPLTDQAIRKAEAAIAADLRASPGQEARGRSAIAAARVLAAKGALVAARLLAEQAARQASAETPGVPGGKPAEAPGAPPPGGKGPGKGHGPAGPGRTEEPQAVYQDASGDPNASMQYPTALTPGQAAIMVPLHEREHIMHAEAQAMASGREIVQAYTVVHYRPDPNTGELVPAGGQAVIKSRAKQPVQLPFRSRFA
jgi:hypothetical protein